ncbi:hypothetical protein [Streptobacillus moniliformis]|uniref:hypothetical protein n=1 Tax=Streptobacillus moniliformis TaxID=34105 RepID=UPI0007E402F7|nr:hypothetical protein [Streptobacillus moniliformis]
MRKSLLICLIMMSMITFTRPRYRIDSTLVYGLEFNINNNDQIDNFILLTLGFMPEYRYDYSRKLDFTFGPKISLMGGVAIKNNGAIYYLGRGSLNFILRGETNYEIKRGLKVYGGAEIGVGVFFEHVNNINKSLDGNHVAIAKGIVGLKIDKCNIGLVSGYENKFVIGIETGYTF